MASFEGSILAALSESERAAVEACARRLTFRDGATIVFRGEILTSVFLLESGGAEARYRMPRAEAPLALRAGDFFGERALADDATSDAVVRAHGTAAVLAIPAAVLKLLLAENQALARAMAERVELRRASLGSMLPPDLRKPFTRLSMN